MMADQEKPQSEHYECHPTEKHEAMASVEGLDRHAVLTSILKASPVNTWGHGSLHLYAICLLVYLCSTMNGEPPWPINGQQITS